MTIAEQTRYLQDLIDQCPKNGTVIFPPGKYEVGSLFLKDDMTLQLNKDVILEGSKTLDDYPLLYSRIAGINMEWPAAVINSIGCKNVEIIGEGKIDGQGRVWWMKFWGEDKQSGMLKEYTEKGWRWNVDYDCQRPRNILIQNSQQVSIKGIHSYDSGFWNLQVVYSKHVVLKDLTIKNGEGPSTDGIDIDSSEDVIVDGCHVACNDDNICVKSGRGEEALAQNLPSKKIVIKNCRLGAGSGITLGSEVSGGIEDIQIMNNSFEGTGVGFRIKSSRNRGGYIRNILVSKLEMQNVSYPFRLMLDWFPEYSYGNAGKNIDQMPDHWKKIIADIKGPQGLTRVSNITIKDVTASFNDLSLSCGLFIEGNLEVPIENLKFNNCTLEVTEFGKVMGVRNIVFENMSVCIRNETQEKSHSYER